jgi:DNA-directed RNA polymerase specialized sigma subunit
MRNDVKHTKNILKQYVQLKQDIKAFSQVSSPVIGGASSHSYGNGAETAVVNHTDIAYKIKKVEDAINALDSKDQFILVEYVMYKHYSRDEMCQFLQVSRSGFNYIKNQGLEKLKKYI